MKPLNVPVRFFIFDEVDDEDGDPTVDIVEVDELDFIAAKGTISYERHTVFANGVSQICLTKTNGY